MGSSYKQQKRGDRRRQIIDAAAAVFRSKGFHAATMRDIAGRLGMQAGSLYHYLPSKKDALEAICRATAETFVEQLVAILRDDSPVRERIRAGILMHLDPRWRDYVGAFAFYRGSLPERLRRPLNSLASRYLDTWEAILSRGVGSGELWADLDCRLGAAGLVAMCNGIVGWFSHKTPAEIRSTGEALADTLLHGLVKPASRPRR